MTALTRKIVPCVFWEKIRDQKRLKNGPRLSKEAFKTHKEAVKILFFSGEVSQTLPTWGGLLCSPKSWSFGIRWSHVPDNFKYAATTLVWTGKVTPCTKNRTVIETWWSHPDEAVKVYRDLDRFVKQFGSRPCPMFCRTWSGSKLIA